ncbi:hypothetical protein QUB05_06095 [Microcoleus sp. F10-C6]|uniref:hypothetical protein n=1 Tax=unclassified Microcoleus TaxID=2642155 RepID=UPI002FD0B6EA
MSSNKSNLFIANFYQVLSSCTLACAGDIGRTAVCVPDFKLRTPYNWSIDGMVPLWVLPGNL